MIEINQGRQPRVNLAQLEEEQEVSPDVGETLMMRRSMIILEKDAVHAKNFDDSWLWTNTFRTRCTSSGKVCQVIVDGGSSENMVSREMVEKLNLKYEKHLLALKIAWSILSNIEKIEPYKCFKCTCTQLSI